MVLFQVANFEAEMPLGIGITFGADSAAANALDCGSVGEQGSVVDRGVIIKKLTHDTKVKGYTHHASKEAPQYLIKSDKTDHVAIHKDTTLRLISALARTSNKTKKRRS